MSSIEVDIVKLNNIFEIGNGIVGVKRDIIFHLIEVIYFRCDKIIQNVYLFHLQLVIFCLVIWNEWRMCGMA
jgi:hypothetical protein